MCSVDAYDKLHPTCYDYASSLGGIPLTGGSSTDVLKYLCNTINLIDIWLQNFEKSMFVIPMSTNKNSCVFFLNIP